MARFGHYQRALDHLAAGRDYDLRKAQVHATLYQAEQQRIANLQHESSRLREKAGSRTDIAAGELLEIADRMDEEIRALLTRELS